MLLQLYNGAKYSRRINEAIDEVMEKDGWTQSFKPELTRLGIGFAAVGVAVYVYYLEATNPFREVRWQIGAWCVLYFVFVWGAWFYQRLIEKNAMYIGTKGDTKVWIATKNPDNTKRIEVKVTIQRNARVENRKLALTIPELVDTHGVVHHDKLSAILELISSDEKKNK